MTPDLIEIMARAIHAVRFEEDDGADDDERDLARAALSALEAEGWVVTPSEPTEAMIEAGEARLEQCAEDLREENYVPGETPDWDYGMEAEAAYRAMLSARPESRR